MAKTGQWLSLKEAARRLGVHATTLRRWADAGEIPVWLTPGGPRRFAAADVECFADRHQQARALPAPEQRWAAQALDRTRKEIATHHDAHWLRAGSEIEHEAQRVLGRRLMAVIFQYVSTKNGEELLVEARAIGQEYADSNSRLGLTLTEALEAFLVFRDSLAEVALQLPEAATTQPEIHTRLLRRLNSSLNTVQLAMVDRYGRLGTT